uniref:FAD-binding FR-type domain-containing protein n=1 Tax=Lotharella globosa TaxID=91324 RepID=A0A6V3RUC0_9EUKA|mmetsp:Transcript_480/g.858  ORF Transcript_480/g.858 Transcript_480/m.858 type:complete len:287 (+) Transcript_480:72-932(+)
MPALEIVTAVAAILAVAVIAWLFKKFDRSPELNPGHYKAVTLIKKKVVSKNAERPTVFLTFNTNVTDFPTGAHVSCKFVEGKKKVIRPYTPTRFSTSECELMVRVYPEGAMTQHMAKLEVGDTLLIKGPTGNKRYGHASPGTLTKILKTGDLNVHFKTILMFAGGTGITPMLQICNHIIKDEKDQTRCILLVANSTPEDVMLYEEIKKLPERSKGLIDVKFTVSRPCDDWKGKHLSGRCNLEMIKSLCPPPSKDVVSAICGPLGFDKAVTSALLTLGHEKERIWRW